MVFLDGTSVFIVGGWVGEGKAGGEDALDAPQRGLASRKLKTAAA
jgi:hypothetical protein